MPLKKGVHINRGYATVSGDDGVNYREIAETMTEIGFVMNHSSARNYVLRVMRKIVVAITDRWDINLTDQQIDEVAKSPSFQSTMAEIMQVIEVRRRARMRATT